MNERERLLKRIAAVDFAILELHLYMDSHPNDRDAAAKTDEYQMKSKTMRKEFEDKYGPLTSMQMDANRWAWISDPWPWDNQEEG